VERRYDTLFRSLVDQVAPRLFERDRLDRRGTFGYCHWVEFARVRHSPRGLPPREQNVAFYHLIQRLRVEARLQHREAGNEPSALLLAMRLWEYQPDTLATAEGPELAEAVRDWVNAVVETLDDDLQTLLSGREYGRVEFLECGALPSSGA
jgi:hypothetical protein